MIFPAPASPPEAARQKRAAFLFRRTSVSCSARRRKISRKQRCAFRRGRLIVRAGRTRPSEKRLSARLPPSPSPRPHEIFPFSRAAARFFSDGRRFRLFLCVFPSVFGRDAALRGRETAVNRSFLFFLRSLSIMGVLSTCSSGLHSLSIRKGRERKHSRHIHASCAFEKKGRIHPACTKTL